MANLSRLYHHHVKRHLVRLVELRESPAAIAGGAAIGIWVGFLPLDGVKTLISLVLAWVLRCNKLAAVIAVTLHDVLLPLAPILLRLEYDLGYWLLSHPHQQPPPLHTTDFSWHEFQQWTFYFHVGFPVMLGAAIFGLGAAVVTYGLVYWIVKRRREREENEELADTPM